MYCISELQEQSQQHEGKKREQELPHSGQIVSRGHNFTAKFATFVVQE